MSAYNLKKVEAVLVALARHDLLNNRYRRTVAEAVRDFLETMLHLGFPLVDPDEKPDKDLDELTLIVIGVYGQLEYQVEQYRKKDAN